MHNLNSPHGDPQTFLKIAGSNVRDPRFHHLDGYRSVHRYHLRLLANAQSAPRPPLPTPVPARLPWLHQ